MDVWAKDLVISLSRHIGQTVTIFTTSGGLSGRGFTGVLISADGNAVRLICDMGAPPACPVGSACAPYGNNGYLSGYPLGSVAVIPICAIAAFAHHAI